MAKDLSGRQTAVAKLHAADPVIANLIDQIGSCPLLDIPYRPFHTLARSIISQQLSNKAAATIEGRVAILVAVPFQPEDLLQVPPETLRGAGLSARKATYLHGLAERVTTGRLQFDTLGRMTDDEVIATLLEIPGIGRWTADMFLIFGLKRLDILAPNDAGLQRAARLLYGEDVDLAAVGESWRPYRSIASWYLWQHLDMR